MPLFTATETMGYAGLILPAFMLLVIIIVVAFALRHHDSV
jgi:cell division protein FtsX